MMKIKKIAIKNFRSLKDTVVDIEDNLSLIIGKNNCGKTSFLRILDKFIGSGAGKKKFSFDDFNIDLKDQIKSLIENNSSQGETLPFIGISLKVFIEYDDTDDLSNIGNKVIMDLDPENTTVVLAFDYSISEDGFEKLETEYKMHCDKKKDKKKDLFSYLNDKHTNYFTLSRKSIQYDLKTKKENDDVFTNLDKEKISIDKIISFKLIDAKRGVSNKDTEKTLSSQSAKIYKKLESSNDDESIADTLKDELSETDEKLDKIYKGLFEGVIEDVKKFGGIKENESEIKIISSLQHKNILEENTTVMYKSPSSDHSLPEHHNGLGYMNLISMIFEIKILLHEFQKEKDEKPADINLLFIEEPEVHTHPQMQYIFIKNIKKLLEEGKKGNDGKDINLQTVISTHSSHIVSESYFEDIKYFKKEASGITSKNLSSLREEYGNGNGYYKFLKQYLTLHKAELFFADKAIFIEGATERILLPAMMKKLDQEDENITPLLSQNISIIDIGGRHFQIFEKFINFIGIKTLIITDIDSVEAGNKKCPVVDGIKTDNSTINNFFSDVDFTTLKELKFYQKHFSFKDGLCCDKDGNLCCVYQIEEDKYYARSFEDAFIHINGDFITDDFESLPKKKNSKNAYELANAIQKKPSFAMDILLNSKDSGGKKFSNWETPTYIVEGLKWLKQD